MDEVAESKADKIDSRMLEKLFRTLEDGRFLVESSAELAGLLKKVNAAARANGKAKGSMTIKIVFRAGELYEVPVRLRYRVTGQNVKWSYELYRPEAVFDHAIEGACEAAKEKTALPLFYGSPEA